MGRKQVYPQAPGPYNDEMPYDYWAFKRWCVNNQQLSESTADVYISNIRTAFTTLFAEDDATFKNLRNAFLSHRREPERRIERLEDNYERLMAYTETIDELGDIELNEFNSRLPMGQSKPSPKEDWVRAFQCYCRFIRWRIDNERMHLGMSIEVEDDSTKFLEVPLHRQFREYMKHKGKGYTSQTINTYSCVLKRLYNLLIRRVQKKRVLEEVVFRISRGRDASHYLDVIQKRIEDETEWETVSDLSDEDVHRGMNVFLIYREFLEDYAHNPDKYSKRDYYEIPWRIEGES